MFNCFRPVIMIRNIEVVTSGGEIGNLLGKPIMYEPKALNIKEQIPGFELNYYL